MDFKAYLIYNSIETSIPDTPSNETTQTKPPRTKTSLNKNPPIATTPSNTNQDPATKHPPNNDMDKTVILCDSNGRDINTKLLCPDSKVKYLRCPTLPQAEKIINNLTDDRPNTLILHCGTNDLEITPSNQEIISKMEDIVNTIQKKYPTTKILISNLLPRSDSLNKRAMEINENIKKKFEHNKMTKVVVHNNIYHHKHLKDKKHLNEVGVKLFFP